MDRNNFRENLIYIKYMWIQTTFLVTVWSEWDQSQHCISLCLCHHHHPFTPPPSITPSLHLLIPETAKPFYCLLVHIPSLLSAKLKYMKEKHQVEQSIYCWALEVCYKMSQKNYHTTTTDPMVFQPEYRFLQSLVLHKTKHQTLLVSALLKPLQNRRCRKTCLIVNWKFDNLPCELIVWQAALP